MVDSLACGGVFVLSYLSPVRDCQPQPTLVVEKHFTLSAD